jgi:hypothetical protein
MNEKFLYRFECKRRIKNTIITTMQTTKDGTAVCVGDYEGRILLFDMNFNELANFKKQHSSVITDLAFCHDFSLLLNPNSNSDPSNLDMNKLILSISIDRTLQCYKYINNSESKLSRYLSGMVCRKNGKMDSSRDSILDKVDLINSQLGSFSSWLFKIVFFFVVSIVLFCHFFTHLE